MALTSLLETFVLIICNYFGAILYSQRATNAKIIFGNQTAANGEKPTFNAATVVIFIEKI